MQDKMTERNESHKTTLDMQPCVSVCVRVCVCVSVSVVVPLL